MQHLKGRVFAVFAALLFLFTVSSVPQAAAADNLFNSTTAIKDEFSRLGDQGKLFVQGPVDPYLAGTAAVAGAFALTYVFDEDINKDLQSNRSRALTSVTDVGGTLGDPFVHLGVAAALYTAGVVADAPKVTRFSEEMGEALVLADGATLLLKQAIGRGRPNTGDGNSRYRPFQFKTDYDSLPSMHTASSFAVAHILASNTDSFAAKVLCYTAATFVGFSRMYQKEHWASDIIVGAAIGELAGASVTRYYSMKKGQVTVAPMSIEGAPGLALLGKF